MATADTIAATLRPIAPEGKLRAEDVPLINQLAAIWDKRNAQHPVAAPVEPIWLVEARKHIGMKEITGPKHNGWIAQGWAKLGATWFNDDETPWCGLFVARIMQDCGLPYPGKGEFARAKAWATWGKECKPSLGAVVVFQRDGGGHVGILVGQSTANYYVLGGNQGNMVSITPIAKARAIATRWPASHPLPAPGLPTMSGGTVSRNEA